MGANARGGGEGGRRGEVDDRLAQTRIFEDLIQNLQARAARKNFSKICCLAQNLHTCSRM